MTREEAIEVIEYLNDKRFGGQSEALKMAIESLEQEPCDDVISREAVLEKQYRIDDSATLSTRDVVNVDDIEDLTSVIPQPKMGHWITTRTFMHDGEYYCDKCKCDSPNNEKWDYCPNCGARMESEEV